MPVLVISNANSLTGSERCFFRMSFLLLLYPLSSIRHLLQYFSRSPPTIENWRSVVRSSGFWVNVE